jgi:hypothetical protein
MWTAGEFPPWLNRMAQIVAACLVGFVAATALFARSRFAESVAASATALAVIYAVGLGIEVIRRVAKSSGRVRAGGA